MLRIISKGLKRKYRCFNLTVSEKDLADLAFIGLCSYLKEKLKVFEFLTVNHLEMKSLGFGV